MIFKIAPRRLSAKMAAENDDLPPDLEDMSEAVAALQVKSGTTNDGSSAKPAVSRDLLSAGQKDFAPKVAERLLINKFAGANDKTNDEMSKSEFLTGKGSQEQDALQKQMMDAALAAQPEVAKEKQQKDAAVTKAFMKDTGVKKGFLLGGGSGKKAADKAPGKGSSSGSGDADIVVLKPKADPKAALRFSEVQDAMKVSAPAMQAKLADGKWMTPELMERIAKEPRLSLGMQNPRYMAALNELMSNPAGGMQKYAKDAGLEDFLRTFMGILGDHFTKLGQKEDEEAAKAGQASASGRAGAGAGAGAAAASSGAALVPVASRPASKSQGVLGDDRMSAKDLASAAREGRLPGVDDQVREALSQAEVVELLRDPDMRRVMEECAQDGTKLRVYLQDPSWRRKFDILRKAGCIRLEM